MTSRISKAKQWVRLVGERPSEALDRLRTVVAVRADRMLARQPHYTAGSFEEASRALTSHLEVDVTPFLDELVSVNALAQSRATTLGASSPIASAHDGDPMVTQLCYLACRALKPQAVLETGVASGVTTLYILSALEKNGAGHLHSIDFPPLGEGVEEAVGAMVPSELCGHWSLHRGVSRKIMPAVIRQMGTVDVFVHDSLHTYRNILRELTVVTPFLSERAVVISDDIDSNCAFAEWCQQSKPEFTIVISESSKDRLLGFAILMRGAKEARD